jgi:hypothetical protein
MTITANKFPTHAEMREYAFEQVSRYGDPAGAVEGLVFWYGIDEEAAGEFVREAEEKFQAGGAA